MIYRCDGCDEPLDADDVFCPPCQDDGTADQLCDLLAAAGYRGTAVPTDQEQP